MMTQDLDQLQAVLHNWVNANREPELDLSAVENQGNLVFYAGESVEMLRVEKDGFYVRGVKIEQDAREAEIVYNNFKQWLTWAQLNRD